MTRNTKIILAVLVGAVIVLCLCACLMVFAAGSWFINRTVTIRSDSVYVPIGGAVAAGTQQLHFDGSEIAGSILARAWR